MAKSPPGAAPGQLRFRCMLCGATLKVSNQLAGRYIDCPKCKKRTQVPANQKQADEEARDYDVNRLAFDNTGQCRNCGAKMSKNAVICVKCGFDYRSGKVAEVVDKTKLPSDYPTWNVIFGSFGSDYVVQGLVKVAANIVLTGVAVGVLGLGLTAGLLWWFTDIADGAPAWPWYIFFTIFGLGALVLGATLFDTFVALASRAMYGREISSGSIPVAALYFLAIAVPAFILPVVLFFTLALKTIPIDPDSGKGRIVGDEPGFFESMPLPKIETNPDGLAAGAVLGGVLGIVGLVYFYFGVGSYAADLSVNPLTIFQWIGKSIADVPAWAGISLLLIGISQAALFGTLTLMSSLELEVQYTVIATAAVGLPLTAYALAVSAYTLGLVIKRHM